MTNFDVSKCNSKIINISTLDKSANLESVGCVYLTYTIQHTNNQTLCITNSKDWLNSLLNDDLINQCPIYSQLCDRLKETAVNDDIVSMITVWDMVHHNQNQQQIQQLRLNNNFGHGIGYGIKHIDGTRETLFFGGQADDHHFHFRMNQQKRLVADLLSEMRTLANFTND